LSYDGSVLAIDARFRNSKGCGNVYQYDSDLAVSEYVQVSPDGDAAAMCGNAVGISLQNLSGSIMMDRL